MIEKAWAASPLFSGCPLQDIPRNACRFRSGQMVSDHPKGEPSVGLVLSGRVDVYSVAIDGRDTQLNSLTFGECFGIGNLFMEGELPTVLRCMEETSLLYIAKEQIVKMLRRDREFSLRYAKLCNEKIQFLIRRIEHLTIQSCRSKVIAYLLAHLDNQGEVKLPYTREEWARYLGVSRAALFRELATLQEQGALAIRNNVFITAEKKLLERLLYQPSNVK